MASGHGEASANLYSFVILLTTLFYRAALGLLCAFLAVFGSFTEQIALVTYIYTLTPTEDCDGNYNSSK